MFRHLMSVKMNKRDFEAIPSEPGIETIGIWRISMKAHLENAPWLVDGQHILDLQDGPDATENFKVPIPSASTNPRHATRRVTESC